MTLVYRIRILTPEVAEEIYATKADLIAALSGVAEGGAPGIWGALIGDINNQTDLITILNGKQNSLVPGENITIDNSDPLYPIISATGGGGGGGSANWDDLQEGPGITIDRTDPDSPIISVDIEDVVEEQVIYTTATSFASATNNTGVVTFVPLYALTRLQVDKASRIRLYNTPAQQTADLARPIGTDPDDTIDHGVILDFVYDAAGTRFLSPVVVGSDFTPEGVPITITNLTGSYTAVTATFTYWPLANGLAVGAPELPGIIIDPVNDNIIIDANERPRTQVRPDGEDPESSSLAVDGGIAIGFEGTTAGEWGIAIGPHTRAPSGSVVIGPDSMGSVDIGDWMGQVVIGSAAEAEGSDDVVIGSSAESAQGDPSIDFDGGHIAIGAGAEVDAGTRSIAMGNYTKSHAGYGHATVLGESSVASFTGDYGTAIGYSAKVSMYSGTAIGDRASAGLYDLIDPYGATAIGARAGAAGAYTTAIGYGSLSVGQFSTSIAGQSHGPDAFTFGGRARTKGLSLGSAAKSKADWSVAIGPSAVADIRERGVIGVRDLEVQRTQIDYDDGSYGTSPKTGVILSDEIGGKWRITVNSSGVVSASAVNDASLSGFTEIPLPPSKAAEIPKHAQISEDGQRVFVSYADYIYLGLTNVDPIWFTLNGGTTWAQFPASSTYVFTATPSGSHVAAMTATGYQLFTVSATPTVVTYNVASFWAYNARKQMHISDDGSIFANVGSIGYTVGIWIKTGPTTVTRREPPKDWSGSLAISGDGSVIYYGSTNAVSTNMFWKTNDLGANWTSIPLGYAGDLVPENPAFYDGNVYLAASSILTDYTGQNIRIWLGTGLGLSLISTDGGDYWYYSEYDIGMAINPKGFLDDGAVIGQYDSYHNSSGWDYYGIYISPGGEGEDWQSVNGTATMHIYGISGNTVIAGVGNPTYPDPSPFAPNKLFKRTF